MLDRIFLFTLVADALFLATGAIELGFSISAMNQLKHDPMNGKEAIRLMLYQRFPLIVGIINAGFILATFLFTIPGLMSQRRVFLKIGGYMITFCGFFTLCVGLYLWILTLRLKETFAPAYLDLDPSIQSMVQTSFQCCGYLSFTTPAFVTDATCPSPAAAALMPGCAAQFSNYGNVFVDQIFTAVFGMVGIDALLILTIACLLKDRKERERYRMIDEKAGFGHF